MHEDTTSDPVIADIRNFYKVELFTPNDFIERMLFAGSSLDSLPTMRCVGLRRG